jgi:surface antigen
MFNREERPMRRMTLIAATAIALVVSGCADTGPRQTVGGLTGAALGGLLGAQFGSGSGRLATTGAGVLIGGLLGSEIGRSMDEVDRMQANQAVVRAHAAPIGQQITWNNPRSGNYGTITPIRDGTSASGQYCREFQQTITIGGRTEQAYGIACRQPDASWRIVQN